MSLVDPDAAKRDRARRLPTLRDLIPWAIASFVGGALLAFGLTGMSGAGEPDFTESPMTRFVVMMPLLPVGGILVVLSWVAWVSRVARNPTLPGWAIPSALSLLGAAIGASVSRSRSELIGEPRANLTVLLLLAGAVVLGILAIFSWVRRRARLDGAAQMMRTGSRALGTVTNQGYTHFSESSRILTQVTYSFVDGAGDQRYLKRAAIIEAGDPIVNGEMVDVWYDPGAPGDESRIVVKRRSQG
ncbi:DUF3592 domain-containing protein [Paenarthrobacter sp.]|uniref:DUF3592 domain-containing protein n=1 Tax=Paenarthrobacter sp. TaxID=1931993 RepID=UPI00281260C1|nr:DUF3592 domain-containing protein [Paenarthrobacter sp.]